MTLPVPEIRKALVDESPAADDLPQNSPFAGLLKALSARSSGDPSRAPRNLRLQMVDAVIAVGS